MNSAFVGYEELSRYRRVLSTWAEELLIKVKMPKLPYEQNVCKDQCYHRAILDVLGLLNSKHDAIAPNKKTPCTRIASIQILYIQVD